MPTDIYPTYENVDGYEMLGRQELAYTYIGFKLGKWDGDVKKLNTIRNQKWQIKTFVKRWDTQLTMTK